MKFWKRNKPPPLHYRFCYSDGSKEDKTFDNKARAYAFAMSEGDHIVGFEKMT